MTTGATQTTRDLARDWANLPDYPSAVQSGIIGDAQHLVGGGYHISIEDNSPSNYSVVRPDDKAPPGTWPRNVASGIDTSMSLADLTKCHNRLKTLWQNRAWDTRAKYINAFNGWDGQGSPGRYDMVSGAVSVTDDSHKFHEHLEVRRRYVNDPQANKAILSALKGETHDQYLGGGWNMTPQEEALLRAQANNAERYSAAIVQDLDAAQGISNTVTSVNVPNINKQKRLALEAKVAELDQQSDAQTTKINDLTAQVAAQGDILQQILAAVNNISGGGSGGSAVLTEADFVHIEQIVDRQAISADEISNT